MGSRFHRLGSPSLSFPFDVRSVSRAKRCVLCAGAAKDVPETLGETQQRQPGRSPFEAFNNLPDDLHITIASEPGSAAVRAPVLACGLAGSLPVHMLPAET